jgi:hypothetical protein
MAGTANIVTAAAEQSGPAMVHLDRQTAAARNMYSIHGKKANREASRSLQYHACKSVRGQNTCAQVTGYLNIIAWLIDGPILISRPVHTTGSRRPEAHFGYNAY